MYVLLLLSLNISSKVDGEIRIFRVLFCFSVFKKKAFLHVIRDREENHFILATNIFFQGIKINYGNVVQN